MGAIVTYIWKICSHNISLGHESEEVNKKSLLPKFESIPILRFQVMHDYVYFIAPTDYCTCCIKSRVCVSCV